MNIYKSVFILVFFSLSLFSSEFDDIFGENKTPKKELVKPKKDDFLILYKVQKNIKNKKMFLIK